MYKIGFIGCGNMGKAMIGGIINSRIYKADEIIALDLNECLLSEVKGVFGINTTRDTLYLAENSRIIILSVKPNIYNIILNEIKDKISHDTIVISIAPGISIKSIEDVIGSDKKVIRTMPNTPALVNEGMSAICISNKVSEVEKEEVLKIYSSFGIAEIVSEKLMDCVVGVSGSSPAYVYMFIEAMADVAVLAGMPRDKAYKFAAQSIMGSAKMVLDTGIHPAALKDMVCSPGGTTIEAAAVLEEMGFRSSVISAMKSCIKKSSKLTSK
ncbi:pyrroline-5-carboxylate reductase [Anaeromicrobium sediminis]|uniref:Pyrroline-5-carboxylate reductase n=1 Tax=Anaeromicrobium sediminis TaxID=1478221 RepID=A0A267MLQ2_9FIRM|nr:pyrroline-5-carboxylate reductase [Anaeromicrobium sediminis]PAB60466.1 pyrroline-5-carboxylate reductase [Anaeromicrobium sediminis]